MTHHHLISPQTRFPQQPRSQSKTAEGTLDINEMKTVHLADAETPYRVTAVWVTNERNVGEGEKFFEECVVVPKVDTPGYGGGGWYPPVRREQSNLTDISDTDISDLRY